MIKAKEWGLRSKKGNSINKSTLHDLLQNPFYYGEMIVKGELWSHGYTPIISREIFMTCKNVRLGWNKKPFKYGGKDFVFRGILTCGVTGRVVTTETKVKKTENDETKEYTYLATWNPDDPEKKIYVREDEILKQIEEILSRIGIRDEEVLKDTLNHLKNTNEAKKSHHIQQQQL